MGTVWPHSGQIERDNNDNRAVAAEAEFFVGNTTLPLIVYQDAAQSVPHTDPVVADGNGRWPTVFIPFNDAGYDVRATTSGGTQLFYPRGIPNSNPVQAAEASVDDTQLFHTGLMVFEPAAATRSGFVRANGRTIGSATSSASERANDDTEDLFTYLYNNFSNTVCPVIGGRGANAAADFAADKRITVLDFRGAVPRGLDDMGNSAAGLFSGVNFVVGGATAAGSTAGENTNTLITANVPAHTHTLTAIATTSNGAHTHTGTTDADGVHNHSATDSGHQHTSNVYKRRNDIASTGATTVTEDVGSGVSNFNTTTGVANITVGNSSSHTHAFTTGSNGAHTHTVTGTSDSTGSGTAHNNTSRSILGNWLIKL